MTDRARWAARYLEYRFAQPELLEMALTHRSAAKKNNERLEFLGDAFLNFTIAAKLYEFRPHYSEGELSRARASLVNGSTLAEIAREVALESQVILGRGELRAGGANRASVLADCLEAVIGAVFLDGRDDAARALVLRLYGERLRDLADPDSLKDSKTRLQEWLQGHGRSLPVYNVDAVTGKEHERTFSVSCVLEDGAERTFGKGRSRRRAEQDAASAMLSKLLGE